LRHTKIPQTPLTEHKDRYVESREKHPFDGFNIVTLIKRKHIQKTVGYVTLRMSIRMDGATTDVIMFSTVSYCCEEYHADRFIKYLGERKARSNRGDLECRCSECKASHSV